MSAIVLLVAGLGAAALLLRRGGEGAPEAPSPPTLAAPAVPPAPRTAPPRRRPRTAVEDPSKDAPWVWDERRPLIEQVRDMLRAVDFDRELIRAWRSRPEEVAAAVVVLLKDPATDRNMREMGLGILEDLKRDWTRAPVGDLAGSDPDEGIRAAAIRVLGALGEDEARIRALFAAARSDDERIAALEALGELGRPASLPLLEETARAHPDTTVLHVAGQAAEKVRILNSPSRDVELVQALHREGYPMRDWALERIVAGGNPALAHHLRGALEAERRRPRNGTPDPFIYELVRGLRALGQPLSPAEAALLAEEEDR